MNYSALISIRTTLYVLLSLWASSVFSQSTSDNAGLAAALQATMNNHPSVYAQRAALESSEFLIDSARAGYYPSLSMQVDNMDEEIDRGFLQLKQPLYTFGKISTSVSKAEAEYIAAQWSLLETQRDLIQQAAAAYMRVLGIKEQLSIAQDNIDEHERLYQRIKRRFEGQLASQADVNLAYSRLIQAKARKQRVQGELMAAETALVSLTQTVIRAEKAVDARLLSLPVNSKMVAMAVDVSATINIQRAQLVIAELDVQQEKTTAMPTLYFQVNHDFLDQVDEEQDRTVSGFTLEASVGGFGVSSYHRVKGAAARLQANQYAVDTAELDVRKQMQTLLINHKVQADLVKAQAEAVQVVEQTMASFLRQYETGRKSWLEVLNVQRELTELRLQLAQIENEAQLVHLQILALVGLLDEMAGIVPEEAEQGI